MSIMAIEEVDEDEARKAVDRFQEAVARWGDAEMKLLLKAHIDVGGRLASANESYNIEVQSQYAQDKDDFEIDDYVWLGAPTSPVFVERKPYQAKGQIRDSLVSMTEALAAVDDALREGHDDDLAGEAYSTAMPEDLRKLTRRARFKGEFARAVTKWLDGYEQD